MAGHHGIEPGVQILAAVFCSVATAIEFQRRLGKSDERAVACGGVHDHAPDSVEVIGLLLFLCFRCHTIHGRDDGRCNRAVAAGRHSSKVLVLTACWSSLEQQRLLPQVGWPLRRNTSHRVNLTRVMGWRRTPSPIILGAMTKSLSVSTAPVSATRRVAHRAGMYVIWGPLTLLPAATSQGTQPACSWAACVWTPRAAAQVLEEKVEINSLAQSVPRTPE